MGTASPVLPSRANAPRRKRLLIHPSLDPSVRAGIPVRRHTPASRISTLPRARPRFVEYRGEREGEMVRITRGGQPVCISSNEPQTLAYVLLRDAANEDVATGSAEEFARDFSDRLSSDAFALSAEELREWVARRS